MSVYVTLLQRIVIVDYSVIGTLNLVCQCFRARTFLIQSTTPYKTVRLLNK